MQYINNSTFQCKTLFSEIKVCIAVFLEKTSVSFYLYQFVRFENDIKNDISALYDGYKLTYEKLGVLEQKVDNIDAKLEKQDVELRVIKAAK